MRLISKIFSVLLVLYVLLVLSSFPVKAACQLLDGECFGNCSCASIGKCGSCTCMSDRYGCNPNWSACYTCPTSTPAPQPTNTLPPFASPTVTTIPSPTLGGAICPDSSYPNCSGSDYCTVVNCGKTIPNCGTPTISPIFNCSSFCFQSHCYTTNISPNPTITNIPCPSDSWGPWYCASCSNCIDNLCEYRFCAAPASNQYQIRCGNFGCVPFPTSGDGSGSGSLQSHVPTQNIRPSAVCRPSSPSWTAFSGKLICPALMRRGRLFGRSFWRFRGALFASTKQVWQDALPGNCPPAACAAE
jgi:hypothetical protein